MSSKDNRSPKEEMKNPVNRKSEDFPWIMLDEARAFIRKAKPDHPDLPKLQALDDKMCDHQHDEKILRGTANGIYDILHPATTKQETKPAKTLPDKRVEILKEISSRMWKGAHAVRIPKQPANWVREPLKVQHIVEHLNGAAGVGLSPIVPGTSVTQAALYDLDSHHGEVKWPEMQANAKALLRAARRYGINLIPFRSSGGDGIHLLALWREPQDAYSVRQKMQKALTDSGLDPKTEIFPKQDSVPIDGFGNMFVLPFNGKSCALDRRTFEDVAPENCTLILSWPLKKIEKPIIEHKPAVKLEDSELKNLRKALQAIPNEGEKSLSYDDWRNIIFAIHHATSGSDAGHDLAVEFSSKSEKFDKDFFDTRVWPYIKCERENPITAATIFAKAREHGFDDTLDYFEVLPDEEKLPEPTQSQPAQDKPLRFRFLDPVELLSRPEPEWIIWRVLPEAEQATIYGESTSGKSFLALDMACAIVRGIPWRGQHVKQGKVGYVCAEGDGDFQLRIAAYCQANMIEPADLKKLGLKILPDAPNLFEAADVNEVIRSLHAFGNPAVIFIDTLARTSAGANENSAEDMNKVLSHCQQIHKHTGALVCFIHHSGKDLSKGARGSSALKAADDAEIEVVKITEEISTANITKLKGGRAGARYPFRLNVVPLRQDAEGKVTDSCVIDHLPDAANVAHVEGNKIQPKGDMQKTIYAELCAAEGRLCDGAVSEQALIDKIAAKLPLKPDAKRDLRKQNVKLALDKLVDSKEKFCHRIEDGWIMVGTAPEAGDDLL